MPITLRRIVPGVLALVATAAPLAAQRNAFTPTLFWEQGLINVPTATVAPLGGDVAMTYSRISLDSAHMPLGAAGTASYNFSMSASFWGRGEAGISVFTGDLKAGLFAKMVLLDQTDGIWRSGLAHWVPSIAAGIRNFGGEQSLNRLALTGGNTFSTAPSIYVTATRAIVLAAGESPTTPKAQATITAGYGTGMFKDDGGYGKQYAPSATKGMFGGVSLDFITGRFSSLSLIAEHDAWAINVGARASVRGIGVSAYVMEANASAPGAASTFASQKFAMAFSWQTNALTLVRGNRLEERTARLEREQGDLQRQVRLAQQRIDVLDGQIQALKAIASQEKSAERADLERRLREEQEALRRLQDMIKAREVKKP